MCGISGVIGAHASSHVLKAMVDAQHHRGPDDSGIKLLSNGQVGLGHNRLSILDLSEAGHQPMESNDAALTIVFNGEIYNYLEIKSQLKEYSFKSTTDTEVILAAYQKWGVDCLKYFVGMFAFAIWDDKKKQLFCARDRLGVKPFHFTRVNNNFLFSSEVKALLAAGVIPEPDIESWSQYLEFGVYDLPDKTFFKHIEVLPAGHALTIETNGESKMWNYWGLADITHDFLDVTEEIASNKVRELLSEAVKLRLRSDVPIGVMLSGGLDSAAIMTVINDFISSEDYVETFTGIFGDERYDEKDYSSQVPSSKNWKRSFQKLDKSQVWTLSDKAIFDQEAPFGGVATLLYYKVHELAKSKGIKVVLEGQGGDELFAGYGYFKSHYYLDVIKSKGWKGLREELRKNGEHNTSWSRGIRNIQAGKAEQVYYDGTSHLRKKCLSSELLDNSNEKVFSAPYDDYLRNALFRDLKYTKLPRVLRMNDRLSMSYSMELRQPLLDHRLVEYAFKLPGKLKIRKNQNKYIFRESLKNELPNEIRVNQKRFVVTPQREWLAGCLSENISDMINSQSFKERDFFNLKEVKNEWNNFLSGDNSNSFYIWQWINTELWFNKFIDRKSSSINLA